MNSNKVPYLEIFHSVLNITHLTNLHNVISQFSFKVGLEDCRGVLESFTLGHQLEKGGRGTINYSPFGATEAVSEIIWKMNLSLDFFACVCRKIKNVISKKL